MSAMQHKTYTLSELEALPTLAQGQADDLKMDDGNGTRVWLSRVGVDDGMPYDHQVTIERCVDGRWITAETYPAFS